MAEVVLAHHLTRDGKNHLPGDRLTVDDDEARSLVNAGQAAYATVADAEAAGDPAGPTPRRGRKGAGE